MWYFTPSVALKLCCCCCLFYSLLHFVTSPHLIRERFIFLAFWFAFYSSSHFSSIKARIQMFKCTLSMLYWMKRIFFAQVRKCKIILHRPSLWILIYFMNIICVGLGPERSYPPNLITILEGVSAVRTCIVIYRFADKERKLLI